MNANICIIMKIIQRTNFFLIPKNNVNPMETRYIIVAIILPLSNIFLNCFIGPIRNAVEHKAVMFPKVNNIANILG